MTEVPVVVLGDFQSSTRRTRRWHDHFPMARFRS
jgi:hypothetical protein